MKIVANGRGDIVPFPFLDNQTGILSAAWSAEFSGGGSYFKAAARSRTDGQRIECGFLYFWSSKWRALVDSSILCYQLPQLE